MAGRCGCATQSCACKVTGGNGIEVSGTGSDTNPYVIDSTQDLNFVVADSASVDLTLNGAGTPDNPTVLTAVATLTIPSVSVTTFTSSGTWTRPTGKAIARVTVIGAGGSGGGGRRGATSTTRSGGGGGGGGGLANADFYITDLPSTVAVTVGTGGTGGTAATSDSTSGGAGATGGDTSFGTFLKAFGGQGGAGGTAGVVSGGLAGLGMWPGSPGGSNSGVYNAHYGPAATGGAGGGDITNANAFSGSTQAGAVNNTFQIAGGASAVGLGSSGGPGNTSISGITGGTGGGGGMPNNAGAAGTGGAGARGGGGGGGGASLNGFNSGAGGAGGNGYVSVAVW